MSSVVDICNRALQKLGAHSIVSLTDQSVNARAVNSAYLIVRDALLSAYRWNFSIQRFQLAPSATTPLFGYTNAFPLPTGYLKLLPPDPRWNINDRDWVIEGNSVLSNHGESPFSGSTTAPILNVKCVMSIADTTLYPAIFIEALACQLARELCEALTQSNTKKAALDAAFKEAINSASKTNAIQNVPQQEPEDTWITRRR